jgi:adenine/guanine phosphoribosyltransferase-like PRPP-binding protein
VSDIPQLPIDPLTYWQALLPEEGPTGAISDDTFIARLPDGRRLLLPIRRLPQQADRGLASLIINQASLPVEATLCALLAERLKHVEPDIVIAVPSLGLIAARGVAEALGHRRYVPLGVSRKFWYDDDLSVDISSITSPDKVKRLYIDPRMVPLISGKRLVVVDDVISSGTSMGAALKLLNRLDANIAGVGVIMRQTAAWREKFQQEVPKLADKVSGVFDTPLLRYQGGCWHSA